MLKAGEEIKLRPKVYETLTYLVENRGRLIGREELMKAVSPDAFVTKTRSLQKNQRLIRTRMTHLFSDSNVLTTE